MNINYNFRTIVSHGNCQCSLYTYYIPPTIVSPSPVEPVILKATCERVAVAINRNFPLRRQLQEEEQARLP